MINSWPFELLGALRELSLVSGLTVRKSIDCIKLIFHLKATTLKRSFAKFEKLIFDW